MMWYYMKAFQIARYIDKNILMHEHYENIHL